MIHFIGGPVGGRQYKASTQPRMCTVPLMFSYPSPEWPDYTDGAVYERATTVYHERYYFVGYSTFDGERCGFVPTD